MPTKKIVSKIMLNGKKNPTTEQVELFDLVL